MSERRSRRRGKGSLQKYQTKAGERWRWQLYAPVDVDDLTKGERRVSKGGFVDVDSAEESMQEALRARRNKQSIRSASVPSVAEFAQRWLDGLDRDELAASTVQGYEKIVRNHIVPWLGSVQIDKLTATRIARHYRELRESGRRDVSHHGEPLSANSVNKVHVVLGAILDSAIDDNLIIQNPARKRRTVKAPTGKQIRAQKPEIVVWSAQELNSFLQWNKKVFDDDLFTLWRTIAYTGMRRSEALALRWADIGFKTSRISVRRALDVTERNKTKMTKTDKPRVIDIDGETLAALKVYKALRGSISLDLARQEAFVFGGPSGESRSPNEVSRRWVMRVAKAQAAIGADSLSRVTLKGLRHTHATLLLELGEHPKVVQERLGHSDITTTMNIYSHVTPTMQKTAIARLSALVDNA